MMRSSTMMMMCWVVLLFVPYPITAWVLSPSWNLAQPQRRIVPSTFLVSDQTILANQDEEEELDEETILDSTKTYEYFTSGFKALAERTSTDETAVESGTNLLDEMFRNYVMTEDEKLYPDIHIYNELLKILAYAMAKDEATELAVTIYDKLTNEQDTSTPTPNVETYGIMMVVWMEREQLEEAVQIFETAHEKKVSDVGLWNRLIQAYGRAGAPVQAMRAFERMDVIPNEKTYAQLLRSQQTDGRSLEQVWEELTVERTVELYNAYLFGQKDAKTSERILYEMIREGISPNAETIHQVLRAYSMNGIPSLKVEQFLTLANTDTIPDRTLALALQGLSNHANCPRKAQKAKSILARFEKPPSVSALRSAIRSCATIKVDAFPEDKLEALRIGMEIYETATRKERLHGNAIQLAANLLPPGSEKLNVLAQSLFQAAMDDGTVNDFCVAQFRRAASASLQLQVFGGDFDDLLELPAEWCRNVNRQQRR